jgi:hypothetical protein
MSREENFGLHKSPSFSWTACIRRRQTGLGHVQSAATARRGSDAQVQRLQHGPANHPLMYLILYADRVDISTAAPLIKADLHSTNTQLGLAFSAFAYQYALFQLVGGYFADKFGPGGPT